MPKWKRIVIPGQRANIIAEGSDYRIRRRPDRFTIHEGPGAEHVTVEGSEHHIHVHPQPPPHGPTGPLIDIQALRKELAEKVRETRQYRIRLGSIKEPEFNSKYWGIAKDTFGLSSMITGKTLLIHPLALLGRVFDFKKAGGIAYLMDKRRVNRAENLRMKEKLSGDKTMRELAKEARVKYKKRLYAALGRLQQAIDAGAIRPDNVGRYLQEYNKAIDRATQAFKGDSADIMGKYRKAAIREKVIREKRWYIGK